MHYLWPIEIIEVIGIFIGTLASFVAQLLWIAMVVLFLSGGVAYMVNAELGRKLLKVEAVMRRGADMRLAAADETVRDVFARGRHRGRRTGAR